MTTQPQHTPDLLTACKLALAALLPHFDNDDDGSAEAEASKALMAEISKARGVIMKTQSNHSPAPWTFAEEGTAQHGQSTYIIRCADGHEIAFTQHPDFDGLPDKAEANARLIAAAPELLEALNYWISFIDGQEGKSDESDIMVDKARAAIKKARGSV